MSIYPKGGLTCLLSNVVRKSAFVAALVGRPNLTCPSLDGRNPIKLDYSAAYLAL